MIIDTDQIEPESLYKILIGSVLPRPIAWVSTLDKTGIPNLAPFSFFTIASCNPPVLCFAPANKSILIDGKLRAVPKDSLRNIRDTKEFVVNIVSQKLADKMNQTSAEYPAEINEFEAAGLTPLPSEVVQPARVGESLINIECKLHQIIEFGDHPGAGNLVLGRILRIHLDDSVYKNEKIDLDILQPIGRLGGLEYCTVKDHFKIPRASLD